MRNLDKRLLLELGNCAFIRCNHDIVCSGFTGAGKTYLSCAIEKQACKNGYKIKYSRLPDLLEDFSLQNSKLGGHRKLIRKLQSCDLLILDEWMSSGLDDAQIAFIFELVESRYQNGSMIFCSQFAPEEWLDKLGGGP